MYTEAEVRQIVQQAVQEAVQQALAEERAVQRALREYADRKEEAAAVMQQQLQAALAQRDQQQLEITALRCVLAFRPRNALPFGCSRQFRSRLPRSLF